MTRHSLGTLPFLLLAIGCGAHSSFVKAPETTLGRVVVYRNGVAYFERYADVEGDALHLQVPADKVDDFLKSLTVADARTNAPEPISYPTDVPNSGTGLIDMKIQLSGPKPHKLKLTYVTESPSWKPSYRVTLGSGGKIQVQAWAIVDNTSGEDWQAVKLGVGASSAMSFRFDLRHIRVVERETLHANDLFAQAPPMGGASYGAQQGPVMKNVLAELDDSTLAAADAPAADLEESKKPVAVPQTAAVAMNAPRGAGAPSAHKYGPKAAVSEPGWQKKQDIGGVSQSIVQSNGQIVVEGYANRDDKDKMAASLDRANKAREALIRNGVAPERVVALGRGSSRAKTVVCASSRYRWLQTQSHPRRPGRRGVLQRVRVTQSERHTSNPTHR